MISYTSDEAAILAPHRLELSGHLSVENIEELKEKLICLLGAGSPLELDLTRVESVDSSVFQLFCALRRSVTSKGIALSLRLDKEGIISKTASDLGFHRSGNCGGTCFWDAAPCEIEGDRI